MTRPGTQLLWLSHGAYHAHTDEEANAGLWRKGGDCPHCPHRILQDAEEIHEDEVEEQESKPEEQKP